MGRFHTPLSVDRTSKGWKLSKPLVYHSCDLGATIVVPEGFVTDFASVPRLPLAYLLTGDTVHAPAVVHDYLIAFGRVDRPMADTIFFEAMEDDGVPMWRRYAMYWAVSMYTLGLSLVGRSA